MSFKCHLFICTNNPDNPQKCGSKGAEKLRQVVKEECKKFGKEVRINASGCLGYCEQGIAAVMYPQGQWLTELTQQDANVLVNTVQQGLSKS